MTKSELIGWVENKENALDYMRGFDDPREGSDNYNSLLELVEDGLITINNLDEYGFKMPESWNH